MSWVRGWEGTASRLLDGVPPLHPVLQQVFAARELEREAAEQERRRQAEWERRAGEMPPSRGEGWAGE